MKHIPNSDLGLFAGILAAYFALMLTLSHLCAEIGKYEALGGYVGIVCLSHEIKRYVKSKRNKTKN